MCFFVSHYFIGHVVRKYYVKILMTPATSKTTRLTKSSHIYKLVIPLTQILGPHITTGMQIETKTQNIKIVVQVPHMTL